MNPNQTLQLKDVHLPDIPGLWPFSPMAYILLFSILLVTILIFYIAYKFWMRGKARRAALKSLLLIKAQDHNSQKSVELISTLLRRVALAYYPRNKVAGLTGKDWLEFLDETGATTEFSKGVGELIITAPYQRAKERDMSRLIHVVEAWVMQRGKNV